MTPQLTWPTRVRTRLAATRWHRLGPFILVSIPFLATLEEIGWRGYALPRMLTRRSPLFASLLLGVFWALWHGPTFFIDGSPQQNAPILFYVATVAIFSIPMTWLYQNTRSVLLTSVLHMSNNFTLFLPTTRSYVPAPRHGARRRAAARVTSAR